MNKGEVMELFKRGELGAARAKLSAELQVCDDYRAWLALARELKTMDSNALLALGTIPSRVALLGGATLEMIADPLRLALAAAGFAAELLVTGYNQFLFEMLNAESQTVLFAPQLAILVLSPYNIPEWPSPQDDRAKLEEIIERNCAFFLDPCRVLHDRTGCDIILNNFHPLPVRSWGNLSAKLAFAPENFLLRLNLAVGERAPSYVHINDVAGLSNQMGLDRWFDSRYWYVAKQPIAYGCLAEYARNTASIVSALLGRSRKCLIVDLDNTLWGGVIGDDGIEGIELGEGSPVGEAYKAFQTYLLELKRRGVLLAVCSKNDPAVAELPFSQHPEMVLKREDFVAFRANWLPKSENVRAIASELGIGLDACVFVDDNPAERAEVGQAILEIAIPEMSDEPAEYPRILDSGRYFEIVSLTAEDRRRTETYHQRQTATEIRASATDLSAYLRSLQMRAIVRPFEEIYMDRIVQLNNKTNQFNLTTHRLTASQMRCMASDPTYVTLTVRLQDRFGDLGLVSVFYAKVEGSTMTIEGWLMSCRVLNRSVEQLLANEVVKVARERHVAEIVGVYIPTERNGMVKSLYLDLGFMPSGEKDDHVYWRLPVEEAKTCETFIETGGL